MTQLSRPFQIALVVFGVLVAVWYVGLRGHGKTQGHQSSSAPASTASTPSPSAAEEAKGAASPTHVYHGGAPGVEGLSKDINKAHGAVARSQRSAKQVETESPQTPGASTSPGSAPSSTAQSSTTRAAAPSATVGKRAAGSASRTRGAQGAHAHTGRPAKQLEVERQLRRGETVVILFWNPKGTDDRVTRDELRFLLAVRKAVHGAEPSHPHLAAELRTFGLELNTKVAVHEARASEVAAFGSITRSVSVAMTPTLVIVGPRGRARTLTGATNAYSIEQTIDEARHQ
jgi:hypothetical protein